MRKYTLIDGYGRPYITATDRKALSVMLATESIRATTGRKNYALRGQNGTELRNVIDALDARTVRDDIPDSERQAAIKMRKTIDACLDKHQTCLVFLAWTGHDLDPRNTTKQLLFID